MSVARHLDRIDQDKGCKLHPKCLECPEPECIYEPEKIYMKTDKKSSKEVQWT